MIKMSNDSVIVFISHHFMFFSQLFLRNYPSKLPEEKELDEYTNMTRRTEPIHLQTLLSSYHHILILLYKPNAEVILMPLWVKMMQHHLDQIKALIIIVIWIYKNDDSHSFDISCKNSTRSSSFGDTITTTDTPQSSTLTLLGKEYLCFHIYEVMDCAEQCDKSIALIKVSKVIF